MARLVLALALLAGLSGCAARQAEVKPAPAVPVEREEPGIVPLTLEQEWEIGSVRRGS